MLFSIINVYRQMGSLSVISLYSISCGSQSVLIVGFCLSLGVKIPMLPVHLWLPQAHVEAPLVGSVLLAGILLKLGGYGLIRFVIPIFSDGIKEAKPILVSLSLLAIVYAGLIALSQADLKRLIAYSSISHMGIVTLSLMTQSLEGFLAAILVMLSHGLISSSLFIGVTCLYERTHSRTIRIHSGVSVCMPLLSTLFFVMTLANTGAPGTLNFLGEYLAFYAFMSSSNSPCLWLIVLSSIVVCASYSFKLYTSVFFGATPKNFIYLRDLDRKEFFSVFVLTVTTVFLGVWPD